MDRNGTAVLGGVYPRYMCGPWSLTGQEMTTRTRVEEEEAHVERRAPPS